MTKRFAVLAAALILALVGQTRWLAATQAPAQQPEFTTLKADFVPGEKTIFFDDFTDMAAGDAPARFKARGAAPNLQAAGAIRQLTFTAAGSLFPNLTTLPKNFTYEADVKIDVPTGFAVVNIVFFSKNREAMAWMVRARKEGTGLTLTRKIPKFEELGRQTIKPNLDEPLELALWVQDGRVRAFVNGEKYLDANQVDLPPIDSVELASGPTGAGVAIGYRSVRFAEAAPDFAAVLGASGRYVSYAIRFDTDSDRIKPESAAAIQAVAKGLTASPGLALLIEGHTDAVGDAAHNLDLSKRRAEAVKSVLVGQFKIDAARLTTAGLGVTKPIGANDTPLGRAQNRRVEFVKR